MAQVHYDRSDGVLSGLQKQLMSYVTIRRQTVDTLKTIAICLAGVSTENVESRKNAIKALKKYVSYAECGGEDVEEEDSKDRLARELSRLAPAISISKA